MNGKKASPPRKRAKKAPAPAPADQSGFAGRQTEEYTPPVTVEPRGGPIPTWDGEAPRMAAPAKPEDEPSE